MITKGTEFSGGKIITDCCFRKIRIVALTATYYLRRVVGGAVLACSSPASFRRRESPTPLATPRHLRHHHHHHQHPSYLSLAQAMRCPSPHHPRRFPFSFSAITVITFLLSLLAHISKPATRSTAPDTSKTPTTSSCLSLALSFLPIRVTHG